MHLYRRLLGAVILLALILAMGTVGYRLLVGGGWLDSLYMTIITLSTVGYGEVVPGLEESPVGRVFTMVLILVGMGILLYVVSATTAFFVEGELTNIIRRAKMARQIDKLEDHVIVCGLGATGSFVVEELVEIRDRFVVIDNQEEAINRCLERMSFLFVCGDATEERTLIRAGVQKARGILTVLPTDKDNLFVTITARQLAPQARIVARGHEFDIHDRLIKAGANAVVLADRIGGLRMVSELVRPHVVSFLDRMLRPSQSTWRFEEVSVTGASPAAGRTLGSLRIPERVGLPVLAISRAEEQEIEYYPSPETVLTEGSCLHVLADRSRVERLRRLVSGPEPGRDR